MRYLAHSFRVVELFSALPAVDTPMAEVLDTIEDLLGRIRSLLPLSPAG
jgi:hypothetical protein